MMSSKCTYRNDHFGVQCRRVIDASIFVNFTFQQYSLRLVLISIINLCERFVTKWESV